MISPVTDILVLINCLYTLSIIITLTHKYSVIGIRLIIITRICDFAGGLRPPLFNFLNFLFLMQILQLLSKSYDL